MPNGSHKAWGALGNGRFVFKSEGTDFGVGVAIDDFVIEKFEGKLETQIVQQNAGYSNENEVTINWSSDEVSNAQVLKIFKANLCALPTTTDGQMHDKNEKSKRKDKQNHCRV